MKNIHLSHLHTITLPNYGKALGIIHIIKYVKLNYLIVIQTSFCLSLLLKNRDPSPPYWDF